MVKINPLVGLGIPTWGKVSIQWARALRHLGGPLGSTIIELPPVIDKPIAQARNELMQIAIQENCDFLFMLGDDNLPDGDAIIRLLARMWEHPDIDLITGVYWTKAWPSFPYLWKDFQRGPYLDWKVGEFFEVDFAGCDSLMIRLSDRVKALGPDWFSTSWVWEKGGQPDKALATEDFYFYTRAREAGIKLWVDTHVQVLHQDRTTGQFFGLTAEMPQYGRSELIELPEAKTDAAPLVKIADMGSGLTHPFFGHVNQVKLVRFDLDPKSEPDYRCDIRHLPVLDQSFDVVHSRHVLEHFGRGELVAVMQEWIRVLRVGGEFRMSVPNLMFAINQIIGQENGTVEPDAYPWWQLYGEQKDERDFHKNGFTVKRLQALFEMFDCFDQIEVTEGDNGINLYVKAIKTKHVEPFALTDAWARIQELEGTARKGLQQVVDLGVVDVPNVNGHVVGGEMPKVPALEEPAALVLPANGVWHDGEPLVVEPGDVR